MRILRPPVIILIKIPPGRGGALGRDTFSFSQSDFGSFIQGPFVFRSLGRNTINRNIYADGSFFSLVSFSGAVINAKYSPSIRLIWLVSIIYGSRTKSLL